MRVIALTFSLLKALWTRQLARRFGCLVSGETLYVVLPSPPVFAIYSLAVAASPAVQGACCNGDHVCYCCTAILDGLLRLNRRYCRLHGHATACNGLGGRTKQMVDD